MKNTRKEKESARTQGYRWLVGLSVGVGAAAISLLRVVAPGENSLRDLVWAEDGAFPLCLLDSSALTCIFEPYAGYLSFLPRILALITALSPLDLWPFSTNLTAALTWGAGSGFVYLWLVGHRVNRLAAILSSFAVVILPVLSIEVVNSIASIYVLLLVCGTLVVCFPPKGKRELWAACIVLLLCGLTSPISFFLFLPIIYWTITHVLKKMTAIMISLVLLGSLSVQALVVLNSSYGRIQEVSQQSITAWLRAWVTMLASLGPAPDWIYCEGLGYTGWPPACPIGSFPSPVISILGAAFVGLVLLIGLVSLSRRRQLTKSTGMLVLLSILLSLIPTLFSGANTRYYSAPLILLSISFVILFAQLASWPSMVSLSFILMIVFSWQDNFFAIDFRTGAGDGWSQQIKQLSKTCVNKEPNFLVEVFFTPKHWRATFESPRRQVISCELVLERLPAP